MTNVSPQPGEQAAAASAQPVTTVPQTTSPTGGTVTPTNVLSIVSLVAGIVSYLFLPFLAAIAGIVTGHIALRQIRRGVEQGRGMALTGLILSYVNVALSLLVTVVLIVLVVGAANSATNTLSGSSKSYERCLDRAGSNSVLVQRCMTRFSRDLDGLGR